MLKSLTIKRFKSVREQSLKFGRVNLFIGGNGTGKSNLLEAIGLVAASLERGLTDADLARKGVRLTPPELMKSSFKNEDLPKTLELRALLESDVAYNFTLLGRPGEPLLRFFSESASFKGKRVFGRSNRGASATGVSHADRLDASRGIWDQIKATYDMPSPFNNVLQELSRYVIYNPQTDFLRGRQSGRVDVPPIGLHGEGLNSAVDSILKYWRKYRNPKFDDSREQRILNSCTDMAWLPRWADSFGTASARSIITSRDIADSSSRIVYFRDKFMHTKRNRLSVYDSSEGTLFLLFAAIILSHPDAPKVFALDNVDNALNPRLTRALIEQIIAVCLDEPEGGAEIGARQVFLTSHNPTSLDAFDIFDPNQKIFVVSRNQKGHTVADPLVPQENATKEDWDVMSGGRNLSQLWLDGEIPGALGSDV